MVKTLPAMQKPQDMRVCSLGWEDSLEESMGTHSRILAWEILDRGAWWATIHRATKSWTQLKQLNMHARVLKYTFQYKYFILYTSNTACVTV